MNSPLVHKSLLQSHLQCSHFPLECQRVAENIPAINKGDIIVETGQGRKGQELNLKKKAILPVFGFVLLLSQYK